MEMNGTGFSLLGAKDITSTFTKNFFNLQKLARPLERKQGDSSPSLQKLVQPLMANITKGEISKCDPDAFSRFIDEACKATRAAIQASAFKQDGSETPTLPAGAMESSVWLCGLSKAGPASVPAVLEAGGTWMYATLCDNGETAVAKPKEYSDELVAALVPLAVDDAELAGRARTEFVTYISQRLSSERATPDAAIAQAREWCAELISRSPESQVLREAAKALDVSLPEAPGGTNRNNRRKHSRRVYSLL